MIHIFLGPEDIKQARLYWGAMPTPEGGEIVGLLSRPNGELGAAIKMPDGIVMQGNAGAIKATGCRLS